MNRQEAFRGGIEYTGEPTAASLQSMATLLKELEGREDPNSFYLAIKVDCFPLVSWEANFEEQIGVELMSADNILGFIHPDWLPIHIAFLITIHKLGSQLAKKEPKGKIVYTTQIPFLKADGSCYWYNSISYTGSVNTKGRMVHCISEYHQLGPYDNLVPSRPRLTINGKWQKELDQDFMQAAETYISNGLKRILTPAGYRILNAYCLYMAKEGSNVSSVKKQVRKELGLSVTAINQANVRLIHALKGRFPNSVTRDVTSFAAFLNDLCGRP